MEKKTGQKFNYDANEGDRIAIDDDREVVTITDVYSSSVRYIDEDGQGFVTTMDALVERNAEYV